MRPVLPTDLDGSITQATADSPADRYRTVGDFLGAVVEYRLDVFAAHQVSETHGREKLRAHLVARRGVGELCIQHVPALLGDAVDLAVGLAVLGDLFTVDAAAFGKRRERGIDRAVAGRKTVAERGFERFLEIVAGGFTLGEHAEADRFYIHFAETRQLQLHIYRIDA